VKQVQREMGWGFETIMEEGNISLLVLNDKGNRPALCYLCPYSENPMLMYLLQQQQRQTQC
jgi:hypothetical protein